MLGSKQFFLVLTIICWSAISLAQKNVSKSNLLPGPFFKIYHVIQERAITENLSLQTTVRARIPTLYKNSLFADEYDGSSYHPFDNSTLSAIGNVTELRVYSKDKGALRGFYWGPFLSFIQFKLASSSFPGRFTDRNELVYRADLKQEFKVNVMGVGIQMGTQGLIKNLVAVDWTILGFGIGRLAINSSVEATNTSANFDFRNYGDEVENMKFKFEKVVPLRKTIGPDKVSFGAKVPWFYLKTGLSIGIAYK